MRVGIFPVPPSQDIHGRLIGYQVITATGAGTYTPTPGTGSIVIEMVGGGGGGGRAAASSGGQASVGVGGSGAGWLRKRLTANFSGAGYVVGAAGAADTGSDPGNGGDTTFTDTAATVYTAAKGLAGVRGVSQPVPFVRQERIAGGAATNGDVNIAGESTFGGVAVGAINAMGSKGGDSILGMGGRGGAFGGTGNDPGLTGTGYGSGGGGGASTDGGGAANGGAGAPGVILISEYEAVQPSRVVVCAADESDSDNTLHNDADLKFDVEANAVYLVEVSVGFMTGASNTPDAKTGWTLPAGATLTEMGIGLGDTVTVASGFSMASRYQNSSPTTPSAWGVLSTATLVGGSWFIGKIIVRTGGTAGTVQLQWAQNTTTGGTPTVRKADSWMRYTKVA
jgi:hypothetical protein